MSISLTSLIQNNSLSGVQALTAASSIQNKTAASTSVGSSDSTGQSSTSSLSQILSQLDQLSQTNPTEFKKVTSDISTALTQEASKTSGTQSAALTNLAKQFATASQTGSLSDLKLGGGGHHRGGGGGGSSSTLLAALTASQSSSSTSSILSSSSSTTSSANSLFTTAFNTINQVVGQDLGTSAGSTSLLPTSA